MSILVTATRSVSNVFNVFYCRVYMYTKAATLQTFFKLPACNPSKYILQFFRCPKHQSKIFSFFNE